MAGKAKRAARKAVRAQQRTEPRVSEAKGKAASAVAKQALEMTSGSGGIFTFKVQGDMLVGEILSVKKEKGRYGEQLRVTVREESGAVLTVFANQSMERGLEDAGAKVGSVVAIRYIESVSTGRGRPFRVFAVASSNARVAKAKKSKK